MPIALERFLVGAFSFKEKRPTITVGSCFQATISLRMVYFSYNSYLVYEVVFLHHPRNSTGPKGTPLEHFRPCEILFRKNFSPKIPLQFFDIFRQNGCWKITRVPPFSFFRHCETFFQKFFSMKGSPIHQYFDALKSFCNFRALDTAPTWDVPGLLLSAPMVVTLNGPFLNSLSHQSFVTLPSG